MCGSGPLLCCANGGPRQGVLEDLVGALDDENRWVRCYALEAIGNMGAEAAPAVTVVIAQLEPHAAHADAFMRRRAIEALASIGPVADKAVSRLKKISEEDPDQACHRRC